MPTLDIILITYNRKEHLARTLKQLFVAESPVHRYGLTILNNASTDGSTELINEYTERYPTLLKHIVHPRNIGGNANIARAYEHATADYIWVLCDDDTFDFTHWPKAEEAMANGADAVVVANYMEAERNLAQLAGQLTFVPAAIYKTELLDSTTLVNMHFNIAMMFPHMALFAALVNKQKRTVILEHPLVHLGKEAQETAFTRGMDAYRSPLISDMFWSVGFLNALEQVQCHQQRRWIIEQMRWDKKFPMFDPASLLEWNETQGNRSLWNLATLWATLRCSPRLSFQFWVSLVLGWVGIRFWSNPATTKLRLWGIMLRLWDSRWFRG